MFILVLQAIFKLSVCVAKANVRGPITGVLWSKDQYEQLEYNLCQQTTRRLANGRQRQLETAQLFSYRLFRVRDKFKRERKSESAKKLYLAGGLLYQTRGHKEGWSTVQRAAGGAGPGWWRNESRQTAGRDHVMRSHARQGHVIKYKCIYFTKLPPSYFFIGIFYEEIGTP